MESQKTILWVEDFANDSNLVPDDYDPLGEITPDRTEQIREWFPPYLVDKVQVLEDPTKLPAYMKQYGKNYEFIILDINFENGLSQFPEDIAVLKQEMQSAHIDIPSITQINTVKILGCYLRSYLISKWQFPSDDIVFFSAYCDQSTVDVFQNKFKWEIQPRFFDKKESDRMWKYLNKRFSPDQITDEAAIVWAKNLYRFWRANGIPNDSILRKVKSKTILESEILSEIESVLNKTDARDGCEAYDKILKGASYAFEGDMNHNVKELWYRKVYGVLKHLRNRCAHPSETNFKLSAAQFLLLFSVTLRVIFESTSHPVYELHEEEWLVKGLKQIADQNGAISHLNDAQITAHIEETMLQWYLELESKAHFIGDGNSMLYSQNFREKYTLENVVQLFCMRAMNAMFYCKPRINSSLPANLKIPDSGPETTISPSIQCLFQSCDNANRKDISPVPEVMKKLAEAYICSQLTSETKGLPSFPLYI